MLDNSYKGIIYFLAFLAHGLSIVGCDVEIYFNVVINIRATTKRLALMFKWKHQLYCIYQIALLLMYCTAHLFFFFADSELSFNSEVVVCSAKPHV